MIVWGWRCAEFTIINSKIFCFFAFIKNKGKFDCYITILLFHCYNVFGSMGINKVINYIQNENKTPKWNRYKCYQKRYLSNLFTVIQKEMDQ